MIYCINTIGTETGLHYYDIALRNAFRAKGADVTLLSNYEVDGRKPFFGNFYHGSKPARIARLAKGWLRLLGFYLRHRRGNHFIYQSFGLRPLDILFVLIFAGNPRFNVVAHDLLEITGDGTDHRRGLKLWIYRHCIPAVICHSENSLRDLKAFGYTGRTIYYPHFSYDFPKEVDMARVGRDVIDAVAPGKTNYLFFGQLRATKGIAILLDAIDHLAQEGRTEDINIIIAGHDKQGFMTGQPDRPFVRPVCRYIDDSELNYLFTHSQFVLLPYTEIYQSGVLEAVIYFRRPALMSDVAYFTQMKAAYPSFGDVYAPNSGTALAECIGTHVGSTASYFTDSDIRRYEEQHDVTRLVEFVRQG